jgi:Zn-dependent protease with chaperone function
MNILIKENDKQLGPFSREQLNDMVYSGSISRSSLARADGSAEWRPLGDLLTPAPPVVPASVAVPLSLNKLRDPLERTTLTWLFIAALPGAVFLLVWIVASYGVMLFVMGIVALLMTIGQLWFVAYIKANAIRASETQLPELFKVVQSSCDRLGIQRPDVYVLQQNVWNAFAMKIWGRRMVVLLSGAIDSILLTGDMQQLSWVVSHELGHHAAGHLDFKRKLANLGDWCIWLKLWYSRRREFTCDRIALYCVGNLKTSQLALMNLTVGSQLAGKVNLRDALLQWQMHRGEFFVKYRTLCSTHPHHLARLENLTNAATEFGIT